MAGATWSGAIRSNSGQVGEVEKGIAHAGLDGGAGRGFKAGARCQRAADAFSGFEGVDQQHRDGHGADAAGHRGDVAGHLP